MYHDTKTTQIGKIHYCIYCGEEATNDFEYCDRDRWDYHYCTCDKAVAEVAYQAEQETLNRKIESQLTPDTGTKEKLSKLRYEYDLKQLKNRYGVK